MSPPASSSRDIQTESRKEVVKSVGPEMKLSKDRRSSSSLDYVSPLAFKESPVQEIQKGVKIDVARSPTVLDPLEQCRILGYLRSKCHSWARLQTEGYILGPGNTRNKQRPPKGCIEMHEFRGTPHGARQTEGFCQAIALDCEMVRVKKGRQDVAFLSAVDFFTNKILISRYVVPSEEVVDWRSDFSGITQVIMNAAISSGAVFYNWREARDKLWEFMDDSTILVGQSLNYDLEVLGICHANIVDTAILTAEAVFSSSVPNKPLPRMWSLKTLANDFLSLEIQTSTLGHSAVEDACAAREIAIWCSRNPGKLESWAENSRIREKARKFKKKSQRHCKGSSKRNLPASQQSSRVQEHDTAYYDHSDDLRLSDLAEALGYPEDYDPWSD